MTVGIMQPYFLPYVGYWQLLSTVDRFVLYDNIQYTKKGWINRNRFLRNGTDAFFTVPVRKGSDFLDVRDRSVADDFDRQKLLDRLTANYRRAPCFASAFPIVEQVVGARHSNLFEYLHHGIRIVADWLGIKTPIVISSSVAIDHALRGQDKVLALCRALGADAYINAIGGRELYSKAAFQEQGVSLAFIQTRPIRYRQFGDPFVPNLSIVDTMMFNSKDDVRGMLGEYDLV